MCNAMNETLSDGVKQFEDFKRLAVRRSNPSDNPQSHKQVDDPCSLAQYVQSMIMCSVV